MNAIRNFALALTAASTLISASAAFADDTAKALPAALREAGVLHVGTSIPFPPMEFFADDGKTPTGVDIDLISEVAKRLGLKTEFVNMDWDGLIPAMNGGRFEVIAASLGDFEERRDKADFADYMQIGVEAVIAKKDTTDYKTDTDLCGKTVSTSKGSATTTIAEQLAAKCKAENKPEMTIKIYPEDNDGLLAVRSSRGDAHLLDTVAAQYEASTPKGKEAFRTVLPDLQPTKIIYGFAVDKKNKQIADAISATLSDMMADGSYKAILEKYGVADTAIPKATVNAGGKQGQ